VDPGGNTSLEAFWARHQACPGEVEIAPPGAADLTEEGVLLSIRCPGCGESLRREFDYMGALRDAALRSGMTAAEFDALAERDDGPEQIERRLRAWPGLVPMLLGRLRQAQGDGPRN